MIKAIDLKVEEFTSPNVVTAKTDEPLNSVFAKMQSHGVRHIPVVSSEKIVGIISQRDLYSVERSELETKKAQDIMTADPFTVSKSDFIHDVAFEMSSRKIGSAIVEDGGEVYGIFTTTDALNALVEVVRNEIT